MSKKLTNEEVANEIKNFKLWSIENKKLYRKIIFKDFVSAFSFMTHIAIHAEKLNHHPEWKNVYNQIEVWLTTHDANGISKKDFELAKIIDEHTK